MGKGAEISYEYIPIVGSKTARTVYAAKEDSHVRTRASRRSDQKLLNDIQTRLAAASFTQPARDSRPRRRAFIRRGSAPSVSYRNQSTYDDFELVFPEKLTTKNLPPCARRAYNRGINEQRSASVPPSPPSRVITSKSSTAFQSSGGGFIDLGSPLFRVVDGGPAVKPTYMSSYARTQEAKRPLKIPSTEECIPLNLNRRRYSFAFENPDDFRKVDSYTPQLRTAQAYSVAVPRPYVRRHVPLQMAAPRYDAYTHRGEGDYVPTAMSRSFRAASEPRRMLPTASLAISQARTSLGRIERELGMGVVSLDDSPVFDEPVVHSSHIVPVASSRNLSAGWVRGSQPMRRPSYTYGVASRPPVAPRTTRHQEIEARLETLISPDLSPPISYAALRSRTSDARTKMDQHKVLLDRYLPLPTGTPNEVPYEVEYRFNELAERMPQLRPRQRYDRASSLPPVRPVTTPTPGRTPVNEYRDSIRGTPFRPTMSDTRKRARDVLCRTKRDPHYFDY